MHQMQINVGKRHFATSHVIVLGNEKGGSGKTTTAMHLIVALLKAGKSVGSIDIDSRQQSLTRYIENRRIWAIKTGKRLLVPKHFTVTLGPDTHIKKDDEREFAAFADAVSRLENSCDFLIIDAPGNDNYLSRLGHSMADTLVTPINDSFLDFDVIGVVNGDEYNVSSKSKYSGMVEHSRKRRLSVDGGTIDWIVLRNRLSPLRSNNNRRVDSALRAMSHEMDFRIAPGLSERVVFRELFPRGLTLFDILDDTPEVEVTMSHLAARIEIRALLNTLRLPFRLAEQTQPPPEAAVSLSY